MLLACLLAGASPAFAQEAGRGIFHDAQSWKEAFLSTCPFVLPFAIKTNLYSLTGFTSGGDHVAPMPNLAVEYFMARRWSVEAGMTYSYFDYDNNRRFWGLSAYRVEPRYWFLRSGVYPLIYIGLFTQAGDYDIHHTTNYTGKYWLAGLSAGWYLALTKHLGIELGARVGHRNTKTTLYSIENGTNYLDERHWRNAFGLMGVNASVVVKL